MGNLDTLLSTATGMRKDHVSQVTNKHIVIRLTCNLIIGVEDTYKENKATWTRDPG